MVRGVGWRRKDVGAKGSYGDATAGWFCFLQEVGYVRHQFENWHVSSMIPVFAGLLELEGGRHNKDGVTISPGSPRRST